MFMSNPRYHLSNQSKSNFYYIDYVFLIFCLYFTIYFQIWFANIFFLYTAYKEDPLNKYLRIKKKWLIFFLLITFIILTEQINKENNK